MVVKLCVIVKVMNVNSNPSEFNIHFHNNQYDLFKLNDNLEIKKIKFGDAKVIVVDNIYK